MKGCFLERGVGKGLSLETGSSYQSSLCEKVFLLERRWRKHSHRKGPHVGQGPAHIIGPSFLFFPPLNERGGLLRKKCGKGLTLEKGSSSSSSHPYQRVPIRKKPGEMHSQRKGTQLWGRGLLTPSRGCCLERSLGKCLPRGRCSTCWGRGLPTERGAIHPLLLLPHL